MQHCRRRCAPSPLTGGHLAHVSKSLLSGQNQVARRFRFNFWTAEWVHVKLKLFFKCSLPPPPQKNLVRKCPIVSFISCDYSYTLTPPRLAPLSCSTACPGRELSPSSLSQQAAVNLNRGRCVSSFALTTVYHTQHSLFYLKTSLSLSPSAAAYFRQTCPCQGWGWGRGWRGWSTLTPSLDWLGWTR